MWPELASTARYITAHARQRPAAIAIVENGAAVSYRDMAADLVRAVIAIKASGVKPGMLAGIDTPSRYQHLLLLLACEVIGAATVSLLGPDDEMARYCDVLLVRDVPIPDRSPIVMRITPEWPADCAMPGFANGLEPFQSEIVANQIARIVRTSGTTGRPKAIALSNATLQLRIARAIERLPADILPRPRMLCLYHLALGGIHMRVLSTLWLGGTIWFAVGEDAAGLIAAGAVNHLLFTVGDLERMIDNALPPPPGNALHVLLFGAAISPQLRQRVRAKLNASSANPYAAIETDPIAMLGDDGVGTMCCGAEVRIADHSGNDSKTGESGMIWARTDTMVHGYFNDPALTEAAFADGWYRTGDVGFVPVAGQLVVLGRADEMLNIGGVKVAPSPMEALMKAIDGVSDAVIISVASADGVGSLIAAVEIDNQPPPAEPVQEIGAILSRYVGTFTIMPMRCFPRTNSGKVKRHEIEAEFRRRTPRELIAVR